MKTRTFIVSLLIAAILAAGGYALYSLGLNRGTMKSLADPVARADSSTEKGTTDASGRRILYWHDPMVPGQKFDKPGKSPFMDMQLVPVYADGEGDEGTVKISPRVQQNLGIRTAEVTVGTLKQTLEAVGSVAYNERDVAVVQARSNGFLEKLYVRAPLDPVHKGEPLAELYVPEWVAAQEDYLSAKRIAAAGALGNRLDGLQEGARQRMRLSGMTEDQIKLVETTGTVHARLTLHAPISGVVSELGAREGMTVMAGATLFRINGLSTVWVNAEVPENIASRILPGTSVTASLAALPGTTFKGRVDAILPEVSAATRTMKMRIEVTNAKGQLVPGMFVTVNFAPTSTKETLLVPTEAVIQTGTRTVVMVMQGSDAIVPVEVQAGIESGGQTEIRSGLQAGQKVVVSGQFLIDSEASLRGTTARMGDMQSAKNETAPTQTHRGEGKVERIEKDQIILSHGPIPSLKWGPMTMGFRLPAAGLPSNVTAGSAVTFDFKAMPDGMFQITSIVPSSSTSELMKSESKAEGTTAMQGRAKQ